MTIHFGSAKEIPFVILMLSWILLMIAIQHFYLASANLVGQCLLGVLLAIAVYNYLSVCLKQPGMVPNSNLTEEQALSSIQDIIRSEGNQQDLDAEVIAQTSRTSRRTLGAPSTHRITTDQSKNINYQYCEGCRQIKPPNAQHCSRCHACIKKHYYHATLMANCIGQRNVKNYFLFMLCLTVLQVVFFYKGTHQVLTNWDQYISIPESVLKGSQFKLYVWSVATSAFLNFMLPKRCIKVRCMVLATLVGELFIGVFHFGIHPILNLQTGVVWVFVLLTYISLPIVIRYFIQLCVLIATGKSRKELMAVGLKQGDRTFRKMTGNVYDFIKSGVPPSAI